MPFQVRCQRLQQELHKQDLDALLVTSGANRYYLSGFRGSAGYLLVTATKVFLMTDFRYTSQAKKEANACEILAQGNAPLVTLNSLLAAHEIKRLGFEQTHITHGQFLNLQAKITAVRLIGTENLVETLREIKDEWELVQIKRAAAIADQALGRLMESIQPGMKELEAAAQLEFFMRDLGSEGAAFETIVASGTRSALPHGVASDKRIALGDLVVMDFGAVYQGYRSDMTRTVVVGQASPRQKEIYQLVLEAQLKSLEGIQAGLSCEAIDGIAREIIDRRGYGEFFGHSLGHGVGLAIHENPRLTQGNQLPLKAGMVVTVEPGIYLEGWGGVRIEDMVMVTKNGYVNFAATPKELIELG